MTPLNRTAQEFEILPPAGQDLLRLDPAKAHYRLHAEILHLVGRKDLNTREIASLTRLRFRDAEAIVQHLVSAGLLVRKTHRSTVRLSPGELVRFIRARSIYFEPAKSIMAFMRRSPAYPFFEADGLTDQPSLPLMLKYGIKQNCDA